jgi:hypothetical protein
VRPRARPIVILSGAALLMTLARTPAWAATSAATSATFVVNAGSLSITVPGSPASLGSVATGTASLSAQLGTVSVTDQRGLVSGSWTVTVSAIDFTTGGHTASETIAKGQASYWSGPATATAGAGPPTFTPGQANAAAKVALSTSRTAFSASGAVGNNSASWNPTVVITIPGSAVAGTYSGTITHSVA